MQRAKGQKSPRFSVCADGADICLGNELLKHVSASANPPSPATSAVRANTLLEDPCPLPWVCSKERCQALSP